MRVVSIGEKGGRDLSDGTLSRRRRDGCTARPFAFARDLPGRAPPVSEHSPPWLARVRSGYPDATAAGQSMIRGVTRKTCGERCSRAESRSTARLRGSSRPTAPACLMSRSPQSIARFVTTANGYRLRPRGSDHQPIDPAITRRCFLPRAVRGGEAAFPRKSVPPFPPHPAPPKRVRH